MLPQALGLANRRNNDEDRALTFLMSVTDMHKERGMIMGCQGSRHSE